MEGWALGQSAMMLCLSRQTPLGAGQPQGLRQQSPLMLVLALTTPHSGTVLVLGSEGAKAEWEGEAPFMSSPLGAERGKGLWAHQKDLSLLDIQRPWSTSTRSPELPELFRHGPGLVPHGGNELLPVFYLLQDPGQFLL